ncbi:isoprenoid synthase domain-containing protein [Syncephalastrum racemosum]|uniref:Isoprenoid synthase domain-containing protein n=1 Tax=Syncephalastrum racemosum TaxID=13706 RepID=A0A1X2HMC5_SYNRA|nr:isoprenoid synthase domain-containing protein [Syncephalastrum racemosum]
MTKPSVLPFSGQAATWEDAVSEAQGLVLSDKEQRLMDPIKLLGPDLWELKGNITKLLGGGHPFLSTMMTHFFSEDGRHIRPLAVLLMALSTSKQGIVPTQRRVAEITQMIHTATLLHDDVLDGDAYASNKLAILAGDFLLARASLALAHLRNSECVEVMATCIANIVEGEFMHLSTNGPVDFDVLMQEYMKKTYMRTASLMALSCKASVVLGGLCTSSDEAQAAYEFGKHFGIAHQLMDDVLRATSPDTVLDLRSAPFLFAWQSMPDLRPLVEQGCTRPGDAEKARTLLYRSDGIKQALDLATTHSQRSIDAIANLAPSDARAALVQLAKTVTSRTS